MSGVELPWTGARRANDGEHDSPRVTGRSPGWEGMLGGKMERGQDDYRHKTIGAGGQQINEIPHLASRREAVEISPREVQFSSSA